MDFGQRGAGAVSGSGVYESGVDWDAVVVAPGGADIIREAIDGRRTMG